jgi:hypothetical protein
MSDDERTEMQTTISPVEPSPEKSARPTFKRGELAAVCSTLDVTSPDGLTAVLRAALARAARLVDRADELGDVRGGAAALRVLAEGVSIAARLNADGGGPLDDAAAIRALERALLSPDERRDRARHAAKGTIEWFLANSAEGRDLLRWAAKHDPSVVDEARREAVEAFKRELTASEAAPAMRNAATDRVK